MENYIVGAIVAAVIVYSIYDYFFKPASGIRARDEKGKYVGDDKSTPLRNEAYKDGKKPASRKPRKKPAPKKPAAFNKAVKKTVKKAPAKKSKPRKTTKKK
jgi:hypothetical protein